MPEKDLVCHSCEHGSGPLGLIICGKLHG